MKENFFLSLFALSLAVLAYAERRAAPLPSPLTAPETASEPLFALRPEEITAIRVVDRQRCLVVRRAGDSVRQEEVEHLRDAVTQARIVRRFTPASPDLSAYGLAAPTRRVEVLRSSDGQFQVVWIGGLNPVGSAVYARTKKESEVLLVGSYFLTALDMALQGMRTERNRSSDPACADSPLQSG